MRKLVAVRVDDAGTVRRVTGFVNRGKNRARVWSIDIPAEDVAKTKVLVQAAEKGRVDNDQPLGGLK